MAKALDRKAVIEALHLSYGELASRLLGDGPVAVTDLPLSTRAGHRGIVTVRRSRP